MKLSIDELEKLIEERSLVYNASNFKINCDKLDKNQIVRKIVKIYESS